MQFPRLPTLCVLLLALAACGEREFEPVVAAEQDVEPLPAPLPPAGAVTAMPDGPGPGAVAMVDAAASASAVEPVALAVIAPAPDAAPAGGSAAAGKPVAVIAFADGAPSPPEDNPAAGMAPAAAPVIPVVAAGPAMRAASGETDAVAAVHAYYGALRSGDLARAYAAWSDGGRASGRTPEQFAAGAKALVIESVSMGEPARVEGTAGARLVDVPVTVTGRGRDGREVRQVGSFVMRGPQADGASHGWLIVSAELRELQP